MPAQKRKATTTRKTPAKRYAPTKTTVKRTSTISKRTTAASPSVSRYFQILKDPFGGNCQPCVYPDQFRGLSVAACLKSQFYMPGNDDLTAGACWVRSSLANFRQAMDGLSTFSSLSWGDYTDHPEYGSGMNLSSTANRFRPLCLGVRVSSTARNDEVEGRINYLVANETITLTDANNFPDAHAHSGSFTLSKKPKTIILRNFDRPTFINDTSNPAEYSNRLYLAFNGDPSNILIETVLYIELIAKPEGALSEMARPSEASPMDVGTPMVTTSIVEA